MAALNEIPFIKGHGTANDFVIIADLEGRRDVTADEVRFLCDRHLGIGGDGLLRVVRTAHLPEFAHLADAAEFFMDYRNADGTVAEMCGNGVRVFIRYLDAVGLITDAEVVIGTRAGLRACRMNADLTVSVDMGPALQPEHPSIPLVAIQGELWPAVGVLMPNPHAVTFVDGLDEVGSLEQAPDVVPPTIFPDGVNVEFVVQRGPSHIAMRVHERGVGETRSCGTGACAAAWAGSQRYPGMDITGPDGIQVDVPGGTVHVRQLDSGSLELTGPATLVARGTVLLPS
ncbi:MAG: diaminopimelate epimerase [Candidatus Nanopelagicales bacterium]|nr:diaminopimelate epimerase [Candidatus Nanopelagicales bacterium]